MSDTTPTSDTPDATTPPPEGDRQPATFDAEYVDKLRKEAARYRTEAKANAGAAEKLAQIEEANKTAEQKAADRLAEIEKRAADLAAKEARADVAAETGLPVSLLAGPEDSTVEAIRAYAAALTAYIEKSGKPRPPKPDLNQGRPGPIPLNGDAIEATLRAKLGI